MRSRREQAQQARDILSSLENDLPSAEALDGDRIDGVKVLWITEGRAARDETAFRHALATGHRLREAGERMTDAKIIDAYERAYNLAQAVGADNREPELPPMRDRQTMARRVRGYVLGNKRSSSSGTSVGGAGSATARERKALATMGRKGGQKASERWNDRNSNYAQEELAKLRRVHRKNRVKGQTTRARIQTVVGQSYVETGRVPTRKEVMRETGLSESTVKRHLRALRSEGLLPD
ncbi:ArsR family transcriptional regulator [Corynebacterium macclintockiae]